MHCQITDNKGGKIDNKGGGAKKEFGVFINELLILCSENGDANSQT